MPSSCRWLLPLLRNAPNAAGPFIRRHGCTHARPGCSC
jgi:hypothetical protein